MLRQLVLILMGGVLINNYVLQQFLGICPALGVSKKFNQAFGMGISVTFVMVFATLVTWPIYYYLLSPGYTYLQTIVFILVIASLVQLVEIILKRFIPSLHKSLGIYLPLITTNCAVLGVTINNITANYTLLESLISSLGVGLGFMLAMMLFAGVRSRIEEQNVPKAYRGLPIQLMAAAIVALALFAF